MIGVNFQPGSNQDEARNGSPRPGASGVQEAIKVLSLRLPKVVGAQGVTPMPLLTSQGAGGNPRVDSVVNQIMQRFAPTQAPQAPAPQTAGPNFAGDIGAMYSTPPAMPNWPTSAPSTPRIIIGNPPTWGTDADLGGNGRPGGIAEIPNPNPQPWTPPPPPAQGPSAPGPSEPSADLMDQLRRLLQGNMVGDPGGGGSNYEI